MTPLSAVPTRLCRRSGIKASSCPVALTATGKTVAQRVRGGAFCRLISRRSNWRGQNLIISFSLFFFLSFLILILVVENLKARSIALFGVFGVHFLTFGDFYKYLGKTGK